jgi:hypothetical protein
LGLACLSNSRYLGLGELRSPSALDLTYFLDPRYIELGILSCLSALDLACWQDSRYLGLSKQPRLSALGMICWQDPCYLGQWLSVTSKCLGSGRLAKLTFSWTWQTVLGLTYFTIKSKYIGSSMFVRHTSS